MAKKERSGLGRGLGALLPAAAQEDVSRETIRVTHPLDSLVPAREDGAQVSREHADVTKKLLTPDTSKRRRKTKTATKSAAADAVKGQTAVPKGQAARTKGKTATTKGQGVTATGEGASTEEQSARTHSQTPKGGANVKRPKAAQVQPTAPTERKEENKPATTTPPRKPLFADILGDADAGQAAPGGSAPQNATSTIPRDDHHLKDPSDEDREDERLAQSNAPDLMPVPGATFAHISVSAIAPNRRQPREVFDEDELAELAESINEIGVLQPIVVRTLPAEEGDAYLEELSKRLDPGSIEELGLRAEDGNWYELVMGERRLRASKLAGAQTIPAIIRSTADTDMLRDALLENLHRSQLNPIEEAAAYQQLMDDFDCTQQELSERIARSRSQIANTIRLLKLPASVQRKLAAGVISAGHARALLSLDSSAKMGILADRIIAEGLSVRATEEMVAVGDVADTPAQKRAAKRAVAPTSEVAKLVTDHLEELFETRVKIVEGRRKGRIIIEFAGTEDLDRLAVVVSSLGKRHQ